MGIHRDKLRLEAEKVPVKLQIPAVIRMRCCFLQVAHVLRDDGLPILYKAKSGFPVQHPSGAPPAHLRSPVAAEAAVGA